MIQILEVNLLYIINLLYISVNMELSIFIIYFVSDSRFLSTKLCCWVNSVSLIEFGASKCQKCPLDKSGLRSFCDHVAWIPALTQPGNQTLSAAQEVAVS